MEDQKIEIVDVCAVKGVLAGGRAICGNVGCGDPWKCWSDEPCENKRTANSNKTEEADHA